MKVAADIGGRFPDQSAVQSSALFFFIGAQKSIQYGCNISGNFRFRYKCRRAEELQDFLQREKGGRIRAGKYKTGEQFFKITGQL